MVLSSHPDAAKPMNVLVLMSDEHNPKFLGAAGHPFIATPNLDKLAARGTRFASAYTTSPMCVPARAAFATGRYVHQIGFWDSADAYEGSVPSWHHALREGGHEVVSIGKLHFRGRPGDDHGFCEEILPLHIIEGIGDPAGSIRENIPQRNGGDQMARQAGPGESTYTHYDRDITARAQIWLAERAGKPQDKPWVLFVSMVAPHFPLTAPPEWFYHYLAMDLPMPKLYSPESRPHHPFTDEYARVVDYDAHFRSPNDVRRAIAGYCGLVSFMDENIGKVLGELERAGLADDTLVIYTSDHGDNLGARGLWGKTVLYEESAGVPMIIAGPGIGQGKTVAEPVSHVDCAVTILRATGAVGLPAARGQSLVDLANGAVPTRPVICEYHAVGSTAGGFMLRHGPWKYCHYVGMRAQLFNLLEDPEELVDLAAEPAQQHILRECELALRAYLDPEEVDARAKGRQAELLASYGGREAALARGTFSFTPAPGEQVKLS